MVYNYKDMGLANTKEMYKKANENGYTVPGFNFNGFEQLKAIIEACVEMGSPVVLQCSSEVVKYIGEAIFPLMIKGIVDYARDLGSDIPIALHLDHEQDIETAKKYIGLGFSSLMLDKSHFSLEENIKNVKELVYFSHRFNVCVEAELGVLAGKEGKLKSEKNIYTNPNDVEKFIKETDVDSLAIAIGTAHGVHKFKLGEEPKLKIDILRDIQKRITNFPIILHGASSVPQKYVEIIKTYGGSINNGIGIPDDEIRKAVKLNVAKINVNTDGNLAFTGALREYLYKNPEVLDLKKYLRYAKEEMKNYYKEKIKNVFLTEGIDKKI